METILDKRAWKRLQAIVGLTVSFILIFEQSGFAQVAGPLGVPAAISAWISPDKFRPLHMRYVSLDPAGSEVRLLLDKGDVKKVKEATLKESTAELMQYFLIGLTLPNDAFWVNLRPDQKDKVISGELAQTDIGRIMLEADLQLKKDLARFSSYDTPEGKEYWDKLYQKAEVLFGQQQLDIPAMTRPWITPGEIIVASSNTSAYVYKATLNVMLEQDWLGGAGANTFSDQRMEILNDYASELVRELFIPKLIKEVNVAKRYARLRQVYYSLILAQWVKAKFRSEGLQATSNKLQAESDSLFSRIDSKELTGLTSRERWNKDSYFNAYRKSFREGEYAVTKNCYTQYGPVIRSYTSGGVNFMDFAPAIQELPGAIIVDKARLPFLLAATVSTIENTEVSLDKTQAEDILAEEAKKQETGDSGLAESRRSAFDDLPYPKLRDYVEAHLGKIVTINDVIASTGLSLETVAQTLAKLAHNAYTFYDIVVDMRNAALNFVGVHRQGLASVTVDDGAYYAQQLRDRRNMQERIMEAGLKGRGTRSAVGDSGILFAGLAALAASRSRERGRRDSDWRESLEESARRADASFYEGMSDKGDSGLSGVRDARTRSQEGLFSSLVWKAREFFAFIQAQWLLRSSDPERRADGGLILQLLSEQTPDRTASTRTGDAGRLSGNRLRNPSTPGIKRGIFFDTYSLQAIALNPEAMKILEQALVWEANGDDPVIIIGTTDGNVYAVEFRIYQDNSFTLREHFRNGFLKGGVQTKQAKAEGRRWEIVYFHWHPEWKNAEEFYRPEIPVTEIEYIQVATGSALRRLIDRVAGFFKQSPAEEARLPQESGDAGLDPQVNDLLVTRVASQLHETWRNNFFQANGENAVRLKDPKDEAWARTAAEHFDLKPGETKGTDFLSVTMDAEGKVFVDIAHTLFEYLPAAWKAENQAAAEEAVGILYALIYNGRLTTGEIEAVLKEVYAEFDAGRVLTPEFSRRSPVHDWVVRAAAYIHHQWLKRNKDWASDIQKKPYLDMDLYNQKADMEIFRIAVEEYVRMFGNSAGSGDAGLSDEAFGVSKKEARQAGVKLFSRPEANYALYTGKAEKLEVIPAQILGKADAIVIGDPNNRYLDRRGRDLDYSVPGLAGRLRELSTSKHLIFADLPYTEHWNIESDERNKEQFIRFAGMVAWVYALLNLQVMAMGIASMPILSAAFGIFLSALIVLRSTGILRSAVSAEKIETLAAPKLAQELGRKPNIAVIYPKKPTLGFSMRHPWFRAVIKAVYGIWGYSIFDKKYLDQISEDTFDLASEDVRALRKHAGGSNWWGHGADLRYKDMAAVAKWSGAEYTQDVTEEEMLSVIDRAFPEMKMQPGAVKEIRARIIMWLVILHELFYRGPVLGTAVDILGETVHRMKADPAAWKEALRAVVAEYERAGVLDAKRAQDMEKAVALLVDYTLSQADTLTGDAMTDLEDTVQYLKPLSAAYETEARVIREDTEAQAEAVAAQLHGKWKQNYAAKNGADAMRLKDPKNEVWGQAVIKTLDLQPGTTRTTPHLQVVMDAEGKVQVDIAHTEYAYLPVAWQAENRAAAQNGVRVLKGLFGKGKTAAELSVVLEQAYAIFAQGGTLTSDNFRYKVDDGGYLLDAGEAIHADWLSRNGEWAEPGQKLPFLELDAYNQKADLEIIKTALDVLADGSKSAAEVGDSGIGTAVSQERMQDRAKRFGATLLSKASYFAFEAGMILAAMQGMHFVQAGDPARLISMLLVFGAALIAGIPSLAISSRKARDSGVPAARPEEEVKKQTGDSGIGDVRAGVRDKTRGSGDTAVLQELARSNNLMFSQSKRANYFFHPEYIHPDVSGELADKLDGVVLGSRLDTFSTGWVHSFDFVDTYDHFDRSLLNRMFRLGKRIYYADLPVLGGISSLFGDTPITMPVLFRFSVLFTTLAAVVIGAVLGIPYVGFLLYGALGIMLMNFFVDNLLPDAWQPRVARAVSYLNLGQFFSPDGLRSASTAEKMEKIIAPALARQIAEEEGQERKPNILVAYGSTSYTDIAHYARHAWLRKPVLWLHTLWLYFPYAFGYRNTVEEVAYAGRRDSVSDTRIRQVEFKRFVHGTSGDAGIEVFDRKAADIRAALRQGFIEYGLDKQNPSVFDALEADPRAGIPMLQDAIWRRAFDDMERDHFYFDAQYARAERLITAWKLNDSFMRAHQFGDPWFMIIALMEVRAAEEEQARRKVRSCCGWDPGDSGIMPAVIGIAGRAGSQDEATGMLTLKNAALPDATQGGVDFRSLQIEQQPVSASLLSVIKAMPQVSAVDLNQEWSIIVSEFSASGVLPAEEIKKFLAAAYRKGELEPRKRAVIACIAAELRNEEDAVQATAPEIKAMLALLGSES